MGTKNFLIVLFLVFTTAISFVAFQPDGKLHFIACDVGQGDAILITKGSDQVLIDGGPNDKVLGCLSRNIPFWDKKIEMVVNTHPDADHLRGLISVLANYQVDLVLANSFVDDTNLFSQFHNSVMTEKIKVYSPEEGEKIKIGALEFAVLWPADKIGDLAMWQSPLAQKSAVLGATTTKESLNKYSVVLMFKHKNFSALLTGDLSSDQEPQIINWCQTTNCPRNIDVLKVGHHGSSASTSEEFLDYFRPKQAVISVGQGNQWGHPRQDVLDRLSKMGSKILRTDLSGDIKITDSGN